jgi:putative Holliday junction resolvase
VVKLLGLDYGAARIGLAVAESAIGIAHTRPFLANSVDAVAQLAQFCAAEKIGKIILGHPRTLAGETSPQTTVVEEFCEQLKTELKLPVELIDERFTSREAAMNLQTGEKSARAQKELIDSEAARILLQAWLEQNN